MKYPRPQLKRAEWYPLDGEWMINGEPGRVPGCRTEEKLRYEKSFAFDKTKPTVILHFGAADNLARVYLNGEYIGEHIGGYLPFSFDVSDKIGHENTLVVEVEDELDHTYPYGKQRKDRGGMWYTPVSGLWQSVWLEQLPSVYIADVKIKTDLLGADISVLLKGPEGESVKNERVNIENPELWTPENPRLYTHKLKYGDDEAEVYFGLRTVEARNVNGRPTVLLNGFPVFLHGVLDQGYFGKGLFVPEDVDAYEKDIKGVKALGFNTLRKHIKIEPEEFYYEADRCGMLVIQDMVNSGEYRFFRDTVLGTLGFGYDDRHVKHDRRTEFFTEHCKETQDRLYNHPSVIAYTVFNEGWGQFDSDRHYRLLKERDPSRLYDSTSGWFARSESDFDSPHVYFRNKKLKPGVRPMLLSECGGFTLDLGTGGRTYGYGKCSDKAALTGKIVSMYEKMVFPAVKAGLCGCIYTQLSDIEDEINGLFTSDRSEIKVLPEKMNEISRKLGEIMSEFR
ncbi:MAG: glycoside hydrolase family 2 [Clostridia bacterium]|nr:glycoside hydrolase family 2 [Clostridia bacterium]